MSVAKRLISLLFEYFRFYVKCNIFTIENCFDWGWKDGSVFKSAYYSYRDPKLSSPHSHQALLSCL